MASLFLYAYRAFPGLKQVGDKLYAQIRNRRYELFGQRATTYTSSFCSESNC